NMILQHPNKYKKVFRFLFEILTNKKSILFHVFIIILGSLDFYCSNFYHINLSNHILFISTLFSLSIFSIYILKFDKKLLKLTFVFFYIIIIIEAFLSLFSDIMFNDIHGYYTPNYHSNDKNQNKTRDPNTFYYLS